MQKEGFVKILFTNPSFLILKCSLFHINRKWHLHDVLRAGLAFLTDGLAGKCQLCRAGVLSGEAPDADLAGLPGITGGLLQRQIARHRGSACPHLAEW